MHAARVDGLLFEALEGGEPERVRPRESGQPERSNVCLTSCGMLMRHAPWHIFAARACPFKTGRVGRSGPGPGVSCVRAFRAFHMRDAGEESDVELWPRAGEQAGRVLVS